MIHQAPSSCGLRLDLHDRCKLGIVLRGEQERQWVDVGATLYPGDVWLGGILEPHGWRFATAGAAVSLEFPPDFLEERALGETPWLRFFGAPITARPRVTGEAMRREVLRLGTELRREVDERRRGWVTAVRIGLMSVLFLIGRDWTPPPEDITREPALARDLDRLQPALELVKVGIDGRLTAAEAAVACAMSTAQFNRIFRRAMGTTFSEFALRSRVAVAARQLVKTELSVEEIAARGGFADHSHLHRVFVRYYHCTPGQYRVRRGHVPAASPNRTAE